MAAEKNASSLGSVWVLRNVEETPVVVAWRRQLSMGSIKSQQLGASSKPHGAVEPKNELVKTHSRHITRSSNVSTQATELDNRPLAERVIVASSSKGTGLKNKSKDVCKRAIEDGVMDLSSKKRKSILSQPNLQYVSRDEYVFVEKIELLHPDETFYQAGITQA